MRRTSLSLPLAIAAALPLLAAAAPAPVELDELVVVGSPVQAAAQPGSAHVLDAEELAQARVLTINEALRKVPGVTVRDEEGFGLRPNIGVRGLNPTRSTKVLLLEDGLPLAYAPYGDNASYFHAPIERYERIEVLKGSGMLRFGPQTIGGVINYITPDPPEAFGGELDVSTGSEGYRRARAQLGGRGHRFEAMHKQGDGARDNHALRQQDVSWAFATDLAENQRLGLRASVLTEDSDVSYSGITDAEYRNFGPRYNPFTNDHFDIERHGVSARWSLALGAGSLSVNGYGTAFHRDWGRQSSTTTDNQCGAAFTNARLAGERVDADACRSRQNRNRDFTTWGIEPRLLAAWSPGSLDVALESGLRLHRESQRRLQFNGTSAVATTGTLVEHNERDVDARSGFAQLRVAFGRLALIPALRHETMHYARDNRLVDGARGRASVREWIPGLGLTFDLSPATTLFAGAHEGFAPPRVEDLIGGSGGSVDVDAESGRNVEIGVRGGLGSRVTYELAAFENSFDNQIAVGSIAGGNTPLAQGEALYRGLELALRADFAPTAEWGAAPFVELAWTAMPDAEQRSALLRVDNGQPVAGSAAGRRMPYAPEYTATLRAGLQQTRWDASMEGVYVSSQFADFANTQSAPAGGTGQIGRLGGYALLNLAANYELASSRWTLYATVKNTLDRRYIADRTRGILPGLERQLVIGAHYAF